jgi:hypothetical protein
MEKLIIRRDIPFGKVSFHSPLILYSNSSIWVMLAHYVSDFYAFAALQVFLEHVDGGSRGGNGDSSRGNGGDGSSKCSNKASG